LGPASGTPSKHLVAPNVSLLCTRSSDIAGTDRVVASRLER
jgi:hypothetical protein